jgi:hypothetical protein
MTKRLHKQNIVVVLLLVILLKRGQWVLLYPRERDNHIDYLGAERHYCV